MSKDSEKNTRRLALLLPNLGGGGAERVALAMMRAFIDYGYEVDLVLVRREGVLLSIVPAGVEIIDLGASRLRDSFIPLMQYLRARQPFAMHAMMWPLPLLAIIARSLARVKTRIVGSEHNTWSKSRLGLKSPIIRMITRHAYMRAEGLVAVSSGVAEDLAAFVRLPRDRITVIHNPLSLPPTLPDPTHTIESWPAGTKRILAVGTLKEQKNYPLLLRALSRLRERIPASLLILGDGHLRYSLEQQIISQGLESAVILAGFTPNPWSYFAAAEVFVLSSDYEGLPTVLIEALHAGVPIVSTDCPSGPNEILSYGAFGTLVPCGDDVALSDAMEASLHQAIDVQAQQRRAAALTSEENIREHLRLMLGS